MMGIFFLWFPFFFLFFFFLFFFFFFFFLLFFRFFFFGATEPLFIFLSGDGPARLYAPRGRLARLLCSPLLLHLAVFRTLPP